jgi:hypothetical protein
MDVEQRQAGATVTRLRANSVGLIGLATLGAVMMSPALGIYGNWGPMASIVGLMMTLYYTVAVILQPILFGLFFNGLLQFFGVSHTGLVTWGIGVAIVSLFVFVYRARLDEAIGAGRACELAPGRALTAATRLIGFEASGPVGGFDADGRPVRQPEI